MDENGMVAPEPQDPLASLKCFSALIISGVVVFLCCSDRSRIFYFILLLFPLKRTLDGLLDNEARKIAGGIFALLIYPVLLNSIPLLEQQIAPLVPGGKTASAVAVGGAFLGFFVVSMILSALAARAVPHWSLPAKCHQMLCIGIFITALFLTLTGVYWCLVYCNGRFLRCPDGTERLLPFGLGIIGIAACFRIVRAVRAPKKSEKDDRLLESRPKTKLADVAGMESVKEQIRLRLIEPIRHPSEARKYGLKTGGGVLLYGPPGTGKTFLARAVAGELNLPFYMISAADVFGKYVGDSEKNIRELFRNVRKNPLSVVFVDELETIFGKRTDDIHETTRKVISIILQELDGVDQSRNPILLLGATNAPWMIDEAFLRPGRFDILIFVGPPDAAARLQILRSAFRKSSLRRESGLLEYLASVTEGYSGADLNGLADKMSQQAFLRRESAFSRALAEEAMRDCRPASNRELLSQIRRWEETRRAGL